MAYLSGMESEIRYGRREPRKSILIYIAGDIFSVEALGSRYVVLGSREACIDLFEKKGSNTSDKPDIPMLTDLYVLVLRISSLTSFPIALF
jgi:hypothetical protein